MNQSRGEPKADIGQTCIILSRAFYKWMLELEIFAKPFFSTLKTRLEKHREGFDSKYQKQKEGGYLVYFAQATKYWFSM